jgi:hypothetical protein
MTHEEKEIKNVCCVVCKMILVHVAEGTTFLLHLPIDSNNGTEELTINPEDATIIKRSLETLPSVVAHIYKHFNRCKMGE